MLGIHDAAGRPRPSTKTMRCCRSFEGYGPMAGKKVYEIGDEGLLGMVRNSEGVESIGVVAAILIVEKRCADVKEGSCFKEREVN